MRTITFLSVLISMFMLMTAGVMAGPVPQEKPQEMCAHSCSASDDALVVIRNFEGYMPFPYKDAVGIPTVGFGHVLLKGDKFTYPLLPQDADALLRKDVEKTERGFAGHVRSPLWQYQYDALVSFAFNVGNGNLNRSTLLKKVNASEHDAVPPQFERWVYAGNKKLRGLELRRKVEACLYEGDLPSAF